ncbi:hypothetical protein BDQ94DRAFT_149979 [Aspergillus welwitschiae]|uniref:Uncharacterized protein n=1 Tax=Aspergillus welwitschiae TaxID=1341132 RepID=A0A3F3PSD8_9EURO|nr:hypothetical protein BDQ94DRAFT_149979 [Aspergillus welwitschiae]RDH29845.1 hypothetical protein BDQ94DRAFT_149979 [Aspergillus welwitschiae]
MLHFLIDRLYHPASWVCLTTTGVCNLTSILASVSAGNRRHQTKGCHSQSLAMVENRRVEIGSAPRVPGRDQTIE